MEKNKDKMKVHSATGKIKPFAEKKPEIPHTDTEGYPQYPAEEDIYMQYKEEIELNPEEPAKPKTFSVQDDSADADNEEFSGKNLDVPGSELDDDMENIGSEDEENNYYSLGGENHDNLEESTD